MSKPGLLTERTTLWTRVAALLAILGGMLILFLEERAWGHSSFQVLLHESAAFLVITGLIAIFWEAFAKRAFADEILAKLEISQSIDKSGLLDIVDSFHDIDWHQLFARSETLDIFFSYGRTWRNTHLDQLKELVAKSGRLRILLPDADDASVIASLAGRYSLAEPAMRDLIIEAANGFASLGSTVEVWYTKVTPVYTVYIFDDVAVLAFYHHRREKSKVPALVVKRGGALYDFAVADWLGITDAKAVNTGLSRRKGGTNV